MKTIRYLIPAVVVAAAIAGCGGSGTFTAHGTDLVCGDFLNGQTAADSYPDITDGAQVVVTDSSGKVIGTGTLASTRIPARVTKIDGASLAGEFEAFKFTVKLPSGQPRYGIKVGGSNRGTVWFSPAQMSKGPSVSLGC